MTRGKPPKTFYSAEAISEGRRGCADDSPPPVAEPMGPISPSCPAPISTDLDTAPTASGSPRPPAFSIGDIPIFHTLDGADTPPASDGNESGTMLGSSTISSKTIAQIQPGGELVFPNIPGGTPSPHSTDKSWESGGGKQIPLTDDASWGKLHAPPERHRSSRQTLKSSIAGIWGGHDVLDPVQQRLSAFCSQLADTVDDLATDVLTMGSESWSKEKDVNHTEIHALSVQAAQMIKDLAQMMKEVTASKLELA